MADTANINAFDLSILLRLEIYLPFFSSTALSTILYQFFFHVLIPKFVNPKFEHIRKSKKLQYKIANYSTSLLNGILVGYVSLFWLYDIVDVSVTEQQDCLYESTSMQRVWLMIASGYWAYDTIVFAILGEKQYSGKIDITYIFHHILSILLCVLCIIFKYGANVGMNMLWLHEWNNFLIIGAALRNYFLRETNAISSGMWVVFVLKMLYFISFIVLRFGIAGRMGVQLIIHECPLYTKISAGSLWFLDVLFGVGSFLDLRKTYGVIRKLGRVQVAQMTEIADAHRSVPTDTVHLNM